MSTRKKIIPTSSILILGYHIIGFPLTLFGIVKEWPVSPGGVSIKHQGSQTSMYENDEVVADYGGPYIFYKNDSIEVRSIQPEYSTVKSITYLFHKNEMILKHS